MRSGFPLRLIQHQILATQHTSLVPQFRRQLFSTREGILDPLFTLPDGMFLLLLALLVDVFAAFSGLATELRIGLACFWTTFVSTYHDGGMVASNNQRTITGRRQPPIVL